MSASASKSALVLELAEEFLERYRQGQRPSLKEYIDRHPHLEADIREVFPAMALMENIALDDASVAGAGAAHRAQRPPEPFQQLGDYRIIRQIGHGGMGIVYEAEQVSLGRHVALKVLPQKLLLDAKQKRRFEREAKAAARLHHTNIVAVFGVGEHDGLPYYVMQFIQGLGLDMVLDELQRLQGAPPPGAPTAGEARVPHRDVAASDMARSLLTGAFQGTQDFQGAPGLSAPDDVGAAPTEVPGSPRNDVPGGLPADSFTLSSSSVTLLGQNGEAHTLNARKHTYWQSVARIGVQVADALAYAHKQGILHRDIKPSNLLLDARGTVWVTDFGLAKADDQQNLTHTGDILGTLRYMPPEAFEERSDARGDVYALGLTLYEMLALRPAFAETDRNKLIKQVTSTDPPRLDKVNRAIPRDLVTIVHKAADRDAPHRYPTAGDFAADLQRFLDDEPIHARRVSSLERLARWSRRNRGLAAALSALALLLLAAAISSSLAAARFQTIAEEKSELVNEKEAERQKAVDAKTEAEANFAKARAAVDEYFTKVSESQLLKIPGVQPLRRELLQSALAFYQDFLKERGDDPALRAELAATYLRVGRINTDLGLEAEARKALMAAIAGYDAALREKSSSAALQEGLADAWEALGDIEYGLGPGHRQRVLEAHQKAVALREALARAQPDNFSYQKKLATSYNRLAIGQGWAGQPAQALESYQRSAAIRQELAREHPEDPTLQYGLGELFLNLGGLLQQTNRPQEALAMYLRGQEFYRVACAKLPHVIEYGLDLGIAYQSAAEMYQRLGRNDERLAALQQAAEHLTAMARANPAVPVVHSRSFAALRLLAEVQRQQGRPTDAARSLRQARDAIDRLPGDGAENLYILACVHARYADVLGQAKAQPTAEEQAERRREVGLALEALRKAVAAGFQDVERIKNGKDLSSLRTLPDYQALVAGLEANVRARNAMAKPEAKLKASREAPAVRQKLAVDHPKNVQAQADVAATHHAVGLLQADQRQFDKAARSLAQALALREALVRAEDANLSYRADLAATHLALGNLAWRAGRLAEGVATWQKGMDLLDVTAPAQPPRHPLRSQLAAAHFAAGRSYADLGLWDEAAHHFAKGFEVQPPTEPHLWYEQAHLRLRVGDREGYRRLCALMHKTFGQSSDPDDVALLTHACALAPAALGDSALVVHLAEQRLTRIPQHDPWSTHVLGLAYYRAGRHRQTVEYLDQQLRRKTAWTHEALNWVVLAMAHHHLGQAAEARKWLDKADQWAAEKTRALPLKDGRAAPPGWHWRDWLELVYLRREAAALIGGAPVREEEWLRLTGGLAYARLGQAEKADAAFQAAVAARPADPWLRLALGRVFAELGQGARSDAELAKAVELRPDDPRVRAAHGDWYGRHGRWREAGADYVKLVDLAPSDHFASMRAAVLLLATGDREGYRRVCRLMLDRFAATVNPSAAERTAKCCLLSPEVVGDRQKVSALAELAVTRGAATAYLAYFQLCRGLSEYRADRFDAALEWLAKSHTTNAANGSPSRDLTAMSSLFEAMALHKLGRAQEARKALDLAARLIDEQFAVLPTGDLGGYWNDWLLCRVARAEAEALIEGKKAGLGK
jgi:serine/threonine-protein kinase